MNQQLALVEAFHRKFRAPVLDRPSTIPADRYELRHKLMADEVEEYLEAAKRGHVADVAKELADILYSVYGTILEHGLQDKFDAIFSEVHRSHMSKDYSPTKMIKGASFVEADVKRVLEPTQPIQH